MSDWKRNRVSTTGPPPVRPFSRADSSERSPSSGFRDASPPPSHETSLRLDELEERNKELQDKLEKLERKQDKQEASLVDVRRQVLFKKK